MYNIGGPASFCGESLLGIGIAFPIHCLYTWLVRNGERRDGIWKPKAVKTYAQ